MTLESLGNLGEFLGGLAVLVSLLYLALQIRQNTRTVRSAAQQAWVSALSDINMLVAESREFSRVYRTGSADPGKLDPEELTQFNTFMTQLLSVYEALYFQFLNGVIDATYWDSKAQGLRVLMERPGSRSWWTRFGKGSFDPRFYELIQEMLRDAAA